MTARRGLTAEELPQSSLITQGMESAGSVPVMRHLGRLEPVLYKVRRTVD
ncbi:MAG: hypothetical protein ACT452_06015 [Microthrixaceae bacterium]